jgi:polyhydroxyalkanoate synthase subunit PhaC
MPKLQEPPDTWSGALQPEVIARWGEMRLVRYQARGPRRHPVPVLIVSPLLAKPYVLDLAPGLNLVDHLVEQGLELFLLDFGIPDGRDRQLRFEDHLCVIDLAMRELLAQTGVKRATLLGYCLGGIRATLYAAIHRTNVENLVTLATPVDFSRAGPVYRYVRTLDVDGLVDRLGNVPGEWIRDQVWALTTMTMPARDLRIWRELLSCSWDPSYRQRQRLVSRWLNDLVPFPGEAYRQFVKDLVQANKLVRGVLIDGNLADPARSPARSSSCPHRRCPGTPRVGRGPARGGLECRSRSRDGFGKNARPCGHRGRT